MKYRVLTWDSFTEEIDHLEIEAPEGAKPQELCAAIDEATDMNKVSGTFEDCQAMHLGNYTIITRRWVNDPMLTVDIIHREERG